MLHDTVRVIMTITITTIITLTLTTTTAATIPPPPPPINPLPGMYCAVFESSGLQVAQTSPFIVRNTATPDPVYLTQLRSLLYIGLASLMFSFNANLVASNYLSFVLAVAASGAGVGGGGWGVQQRRTPHASAPTPSPPAHAPPTPSPLPTLQKCNNNAPSPGFYALLAILYADAEIKLRGGINSAPLFNQGAIALMLLVAILLAAYSGLMMVRHL